MVTAVLPRVTPEDLLEMPDGDRFELVRGELVPREMSNQSSFIGFGLNRQMGNHIAELNLGIGFQSDCGLQIFPWDEGRVRYADGAFLSSARVPEGVPGRGHLRVAPDLVFEVVSPGDIFVDGETKIEEYLRAGVRLIWTLIPSVRVVRVDRADRTGTRLTAEDTLSGEDILPGFSVRVGDILPE